jgi:Fe(3+) dicitrate transport protein
VANSEGETSQNYELGARYIKDDTLVEAIFFFTDFDNLVATCTAASGCAAIGDTYNGGAVEIMGLELVASRMIELGGLNFPTSLTYTFTDTEFQTSFEADLYELWGSASAGDELPYVPEHQIGLNIGTTVAHWELTSRMKYKSEQRVTAGSGPIAASDKIGSAFVTDLSASRALNDRTSLNIYINNAFDKEYEVSRHPDGLRPGAPRTFAIGVTSNF